VIGELYEVNEKTLEALDELEGHPAWYKRTMLSVSLHAAPGSLIECDAYLMTNFRRDLLTIETSIAEYRDTPERRYILPKDRDERVAAANAVVVDIKELRDAA